jgi:hypothetical protein
MPSIPVFTRSADGTLLTPGGGSFLYRLRVPLRIPYDAKPVMYLVGGSVWFTNPNILTGVNDTLDIYLTGLNGTGNEVQRFVFDKGLYSLTSLNEALREKLQAVGGGGVLSGDEVVISANSATQKLTITLAPTATTGTLTVIFDNSNISRFLGFDGTVSAFGADQSSTIRSITAPLVAKFNNLSYYIVHIDGLCSGVLGSRGSDAGSELAIITPSNIAAGKQIVVQPYNVVRVPCKAAGASISEFTVRLTDQNGDDVDMLGEEFSLQFVIEY